LTGLSVLCLCVFVGGASMLIGSVWGASEERRRREHLDRLAQIERIRSGRDEALRRMWARAAWRN